MNIMISVVAAFVAFAVTAALGFAIIPFLRKLKFGQTIRDIGPAWHKDKNGTPTMGGIMMAIGLFVAMVVAFTLSAFSDNNIWNQPYELSLIFSGIGLCLGMGLIGFIDDYIKVVKKRNLGLTA